MPNSILCLVYLLMFYFPDDKSTLGKPPNEGFQGIRSRSRFQGDLQSHYGDLVSLICDPLNMLPP